ncbi:MAG: SurA N-terminal domain-containing protein, partial [Deltaproteobacteria bacterium]|nr:SurA N-terminal domain-containing protein [Candidatus Tharpella sp.]
MRKKFGLLLLFITLLSNVAAGFELRENEILATIDQQQITRDGFNKYLELFKNPGNFSQSDLKTRKKHLENLINRTLLLEEARKQGYFEDPELKKHGSLNSIEHETIVLRQLLTDRISRPATIDNATVNTYLETHANLTFKQAQ